MPMVRHDAVREKRNTTTIEGSGKDAFKRLVVRCIVEKTRPFRRSVQNMENQAGRRMSLTSRHDRGFIAMPMPSFNPTETAPDPITVFEK